MQRDRWLGFMHTLCFLVHLAFAITSFSLGAGKPMEVSIFRVSYLGMRRGVGDLLARG